MTSRMTPQKDRTDEEKVSSRRKVDYVAEKLDEYPRYVAKWLKASWFPLVRQDPSFYSFLNHKTLPKEFAESYEAYKQVKQCFKKSTEAQEAAKAPAVIEGATVPSTPSKSTKERLLFVDMCCGKGFLSVLLNYKFPEAHILMVDNMAKINLDHLQNLPRIDFWMTDITTKKFISDLTLRCSDYKAVILVGIHLCGNLSEHFIQAFHDVPNAVSMVLCPCCISKKQTELLERARRESISNYELWSQELLRQVTPANKELKTLKECSSEKNNFILACK